MGTEDMSDNADMASTVVPSGFVLIRAGSFTMGSPMGEYGSPQTSPFNEPQRTVTITRDFAIQATETTQEDWEGVMGSNPSSNHLCGAQCPVERVSWWDALYFANKRSEDEGLDDCYELEGCTGTPGTSCTDDIVDCAGDFRCDNVTFDGLDCEGYRLPTEAEWEYASRAGSTAALYNGEELDEEGQGGTCVLDDNLDELAWTCNNTGPETHPAGEKDNNSWGLDDTLGNVNEWVWDAYVAYDVTDTTDPVVSGEDATVNRVARGGSFLTEAVDSRCASRGVFGPTNRAWTHGLRLAITLSSSETQ